MTPMSMISRVCAAATLVSMAAPVAAAAAPPSSEPPAGVPPGGDFVLPADWTTLVDDTNTITVAVPNAWTDIETAPRSNADGTAIPSIVAATDIQVYTDTFDEPGVLYRAMPYDADQQGVMDAYGLTGGCRLKSFEPYDDGAFVGLHGIWSDCGAALDPEWHQIVASPASLSFTVLLQIQITGPDQTADLDNVLASFNFTPQGGSTAGPFPATTIPGATTTTPPAQPTTSAGPTVPTTLLPTTLLPTPGIITAPVSTTTPLPQPSGSIPPDSQQVVDDLGVLSIHVPPTWSDRNTASFTGDQLTDAPYISATPDSNLFFPADGEADTWSVPGVYYVGLPYSADLESVMNDRGELAGCTPQGARPYSDGVFTGLIQELTSCGGTATRVVSIVANPADNSRTILLVLQLTGTAGDAAIYDGVLSSFNLIGSAPADGAAAATTSTTTA